MNPIYTATAHSTGTVATATSRSDDGFIDLDLRIPKEMGGSGGATNPEELFAAGYAACFHSATEVGSRPAEARRGRHPGLRQHRHRPSSTTVDSALKPPSSCTPPNSTRPRRSPWQRPPTRCARTPMPPGATSRSRSPSSNERIGEAPGASPADCGGYLLRGSLRQSEDALGDLVAGDLRRPARRSTWHGWRVATCRRTSRPLRRNASSLPTRSACKAARR